MPPKIKLAILLCLFVTAAVANQRYSNFCQQGGKNVSTGGVLGTPKVQGSYPQCQVAVFLTGTTTPATLFSDTGGTPLANPFTAKTDGSFFFYAANGRYDVTISGGGLPAPFTFGDVLLSDPAGGGTTVSSITAGPGITASPSTGAVTVGNTWGAVPSGSQLQFVRIQPNTGNNTTFQLASLWAVSAADYNFPAMTPGGSLTGGGGSQTVTLPICPNGIVTTGLTATALYISGGSGTAEWLRPSGGTCTPGALNGTVIISPANNHSGAWTVSSATAGIDLACASSGAGAYVIVPAGSYNIFGTIRPSTGCTIDGQGTPSPSGPSGAVFLHMQTAGIPMFDITATGVTVKNLQLAYGTYPAYTVGGVAATAGSVAIQLGVTGSVDAPVVQNIIANSFYNNFRFGQAGNAAAVYAKQVYALNAVSDGIIVDGLGSGYVESALSQNSFGNGWTIRGNSAAVQYSNINCFNNHGWGWHQSGASAQVDNIDCEGDNLGELWLGTVSSTIIQNIIVQAAGITGGMSTNTTAPGIHIDGTGNAFVVMSNLLSANNQGNGVEANGSFLQLYNAQIVSNGQGLGVGTQYGITATGPNAVFSNMRVSGNQSLFNGPAQIVSSSNFIGSSNSAPTVTIGAAATTMSFCGNSVLNTGSGGVVTYTAGSTGVRCVNEMSSAGVSGALGYDGNTVETLPLLQLPTLTALTISGNSITVTLPVHHVGAGLIKSITITSGGTPVCFNLIADAAFTTDQTGNIATPAITATTGTMYPACYDPATAKIYFKN